MPEMLGTRPPLLSRGDLDPTEIEDLFEELEDLSDSGQELDTMSISSTPKPSLPPFFSSSRSLLQESLHVPGIKEKILAAFSLITAETMVFAWLFVVMQAANKVTNVFAKKILPFNTRQ
ncbi:unnamed protein product, partial [Timema podura]|nr:unnamed protein product [Timema podura]